MANYTINNAGSTTCNYPSTVNANDVLTFNITNKNTTTKYQGSMLTYTFPCDCTAEILAAGARGGRGANVNTNATGRGAIVAGTFEFKTGDQLLICVGQAGTDHPYATNMTNTDGTVGAGGGGTYVVKKVSYSNYKYTGSGTGNNWYVEPLIIGAGGNGSGDNAYGGNTQVHGSSNQGNESSFSFSSSNNGGCFSKKPSSYSDYNGSCFLDGATGASYYYNRSGSSYAGFGGGSSNWDDGAYGSPGGGFTGGYVSDDVVYAATSYVATNATNISRKSGASQGNNGEGYVKITFKTVTPLHEIPDGFVEKIKEFNTQVKVDNAWKSSDKSFVKVDNAWKEINKMYTKINNSWVETGKNTFYRNNWVIHEGFISDSMFYEGWIGNATYSLYTPGEGIKLYTAQGNTYNQYPVAIGAISSVYWIIAYEDTWKVSFQRTSGNTEFEIGVALVTDTSILTTGRLNTTNFNSITKKYGQRFNVDNGVFTFCLAELFGEEYKEKLYDFNTYLAFYLYSPTNASTTIKITSALECFPIHCVMHEGALEDTSMTGNYTGHSTYSPYSSTGISLYKASGTSYPISIGCFNAPMDAKKIYAVDIAYEVVGTTVPNASLGFAYFNSQYNGRTDSSGPTTVQTRFTTSSPIDKLQGSVSLHIEDITDYTALENVYFAVFLNSTQNNSVTVKIKGIYFYISDDLELGGGTTNPNAIYLVQNGKVNNNTQFGSLQGSIGISEVAGSGLEVICVNSTSTLQCRRFSFGNKVDSSLIEKIIVKWKFVDTSIQGRTGELVIGWTSSVQTSYGDYSKYKNTVTNMMNLTTANTEYTAEFVPSNWSGENCLSFATRSRTANNAITYYITEIQVVMKDNSGSGGTSSSIFPVKNVQVYNNTEFGALTTSGNVTDNSGSLGIKVVTDSSNYYAYTTRFSFDKKFDMSKIEKIIMKWSYSGSGLTGSKGEVFVGCTSTTYNTKGNTNDFTGKLTKVINLSQGPNVIEIAEFVPTNWSGEYYLSFGICSSVNGTALTIAIAELEIVLKAGSGGSSGGGTTPTLESVYILNNNQHIRNNDFGGLCAADYSGTNSVTSGIYTAQHTGSAYGSLAYTTTNNSVDLTPYQSVTISLQSVASSTTSEVYIFTYNTKTQGLSTPTIMGDSWANVQSKTITMGSTYREYTFDISNLTVNQYFGFAIRNTGSCTTKINKIEFKKQSTGGSTGGLTLKQGYYNSTGDFISEPVYTSENIATDKISLKSVSDSASCMFTITCTQSLTCLAYLEVWSSDGTSGSYINYSAMGTKYLDSNQPQYVTFTKDSLASAMDLAGGFDIGHVALSLYTDENTIISPSMFTVTFNNGSGSGVTPRDDI